MVGRGSRQGRGTGLFYFYRPVAAEHSFHSLPAALPPQSAVSCKPDSPLETKEGECPPPGPRHWGFRLGAGRGLDVEEGGSRLRGWAISGLSEMALQGQPTGRLGWEP